MASNSNALLTEEARDLLCFMCAAELRSFLDPSSALTIIGHADRVDTEERNRELSCLRVFNTLQALRALLGSDFKIPDSRIYVFWKGESEAKAAGKQDEVPDQRDRRVQVIRN